MRDLRIRFGAMMTFLGVLMGSSVVAEISDTHSQVEVSCFSGGHLVFYDIALSRSVSQTPAGISGKTTDGDDFIALGDCIVVPVGYEG